ncbi:MAG: arabinan endo-1,5-alpha-L-arabinosidase [Clostridia bacterium]|nr:arabinan endo-1,5-alpha-L-arabinosidase [Clostridia bacterium]
MKRFLSIVLSIIMVFLLLSCERSGPDNPSDVTTSDSGSSSALKTLTDGAVYRIVTPSMDRLEYAIKGNDFCSYDGVQCNVSPYKGVLSSLWKVKFTGDEDNSIMLESVATCERYLMVSKYSESGDPVTVRASIDSDFTGQKFIPVLNDNGYYVLKSTVTMRVISIAETTSGATVISEDENGSLLQAWNFIKTADPDKEIPTLLPVTGGIPHSSTPEIISDGTNYYMCVMTGGVAIKKSKDLRYWTYIGDAFGRTDKNFPFDWMEEEVPNYALWSPGIYEMNGKYYLYYSLSTLGSQHSAIGVAVNETLDYNSKQYMWVDKGVVLHSYVGDDFNAIDPNVITDQDGISWLVYGSYWSGIQMRRLDPDTGYLDENYPEVYYLASIQGIEAPYIIYREGYYYLFCATNIGEYDNRVGRSENITGPYVNRDGLSMRTGNSELVTKNTENIKSCAHNAVFQDNDGQWYMVGEYSTSGADYSLFLISTIVWTEDGWPTTALTPGLFK